LPIGKNEFLFPLGNRHFHLDDEIESVLTGIEDLQVGVSPDLEIHFLEKISGQLQVGLGRQTCHRPGRENAFRG